jgi:tetratricopeptide (TPR) repeat protein
MSLMKRLLSSGRLREARQQLSDDPSATRYLALAGEHARLGEMESALRVCREGLGLHPGHSELARMADRALALEQEGRTRELTRELREAPRPAVWRELCEHLLNAGRVDRAEECAQEWYKATGDGQAQLVRAQARLERYFADRRRDDGRLALELLDSSEKLLPRDARPLRLRLALMSRIGAWKEARYVVSQLLELEPGDPVLEARFRTLSSLADKAPSLDQALRDVERTGRLTDEEPQSESSLDPTGERALAAPAIRPRLQKLAHEPGIQAAIFVRGATALVQGPRGATAERLARGVREIVHRSRTAARRLGLGQPLELTLEGSFGELFVVPGDPSTCASWSSRTVLERQRRELHDLSGSLGSSEEEEGA